MATDTFGKLTDGVLSSSLSSDVKFVSTGSPGSNGTVLSLTARLWVSSVATVAKGVIYADSGGNPGARLAVSDEVAISNTSEEAMVFNFSGGDRIAVTQGTVYHIGVHVQDPGGTAYFLSHDGDANQIKYSLDTYSDGPTDPFGAPVNYNGPLDAYVTYQVAVAGRRRRLLASGVAA